MEPLLACTVRGCGRPLEQHAAAMRCPRGHSFDIARTGYINLLQPQDRRSTSPGDAKAAVEARARLLSSGVGRATIDAAVARAASLELGGDPVVADLGSGSGEFLGELAAKRSVRAVGIDISTAAADHAARRFPAVTWVVANADRRLPLPDRAVRLVTSLHGRRNPAECARVLGPGGFLLVAVPAADDLIELREYVEGHPVQRARGPAVVAEHERLFTPIDQATVRERRRIERDMLLELLQGTYRGARRSLAPQIAALTTREVTLAADLLLFRSAAAS